MQPADTFLIIQLSNSRLASGAAIILAALERGLYPNWDAQNMMSVGTAQKLGYHYKGPYTIFEVTA